MRTYFFGMFFIATALPVFATALPVPATARSARSHHERGVAAKARGDLELAESEYTQAVAEWERAGESGAELAVTLFNLGELYRETARLPRAEATLLRALELGRSARAAHPELYPEALTRLAGIYSDTDRPERGRPLVTEAIGLLTPPVPRLAAELGYAHNVLGLIDLNAGQYKAGEEEMRAAVSLAVSSLGEDHPETQAYRTNLALAYMLQGREGNAGPILERCRLVLERELGPWHPALIPVFAELSGIARAQGKPGIAEEYGRRELALLERQSGTNPLAVALAQVSLARIYIGQRRAAEAERILPGAVAAERRLAPNGRVLADALLRLAELRGLQQSWQESEGLYREAIGLYEAQPGPKHPELPAMLRAYAGAIRHAGGSKAEAKTAESRARALRSLAPPA